MVKRANEGRGVETEQNSELDKEEEEKKTTTSTKEEAGKTELTLLRLLSEEREQLKT